MHLLCKHVRLTCFKENKLMMMMMNRSRIEVVDTAWSTWHAVNLTRLSTDVPLCRRACHAATSLGR